MKKLYLLTITEHQGEIEHDSLRYFHGTKSELNQYIKTIKQTGDGRYEDLSSRYFHGTKSELNQYIKTIKQTGDGRYEDLDWSVDYCTCEVTYHEVYQMVVSVWSMNGKQIESKDVLINYKP
jgi:hypothetical protein